RIPTERAGTAGSLPNLEARQPLRRLGFDIDRRDLGVPRPAPHELDHRVDGLGRPLEHGLGRAVAVVARPARDTAPVRLAPHRVAEEDALHAPGRPDPAPNGVLVHAEYRKRMAAIEVLDTDITTLDVDAIANAANTRLMHGGGVAGVISRAGGATIQDESDAKAPIGLGEAIETSAGDMPSRWVIHAATM